MQDVNMITVVDAKLFTMLVKRKSTVQVSDEGNGNWPSQ